MATKKLQIIGNLLDGVATEEEVTQIKSNISELESELANKASTSTTLEGYGITDAYSKTSGEELKERVVDAEGHISTMQADLDTAEAKIAANEIAIGSFTPITPDEVDALFV
jgi:hypothetical protein